MSKPREVKKEIGEYLRELNLPTMRRSFEEKSRQAERETMGYERSFCWNWSNANARNGAPTASSGCCKPPNCRWKRRWTTSI